VTNELGISSHDTDLYRHAVESLRSASEVVYAAQREMFREPIASPDDPPHDPPSPFLEVGIEEVDRLGDLIDETVDEALRKLEALGLESEGERWVIEEAEAEWLYDHVFGRAYAYTRQRR